MDAIEAPQIERLGAADAADGLALSQEVGWNQNRADWDVFLEAGLVFGVRDRGRVIATSALLPMPPVTWLSLVIVTATHRRRGLANALVAHCLAEAAARGLQPHLDATPAGATVYGPMGFVETGLSLRRLRRAAGVAAPCQSAPVTPSDLEGLCAADRAALGVDRSAILHRLARRPRSIILSGDGAIALVRDGLRARHIGPLIADDDQAAAGLLDKILRADPSPMVVDLADAHAAVADTLIAAGFSIERPFARMRLGPSKVDGAAARLVAGAGPEFG